ncbi:MAG: amidohydrolase family protein [Blastocatellia bacterium]
MTNSISRRAFVQTSGLALTGMALSEHMATAAEPVVVDSHLHCFAGRGDARFPYHPRGPYQPAEPATPEMLLKLMDAAGVHYSVVVHPEPYQDDHRYLDYCLSVGKDRVKATCLVFSDQPASMKLLPGLAKNKAVRAVRVHAYAPDRQPPFGKPELRALWKQASDLGLMVQIHLEPRYAPGFTPYIKEFSQTKVIIDHLGRPFQGTPEEHAVVMEWAKMPNTVMKLAALPQQSEYPHRDISPIVRRLCDAWGPDRMIYGGGFGPTATGASYRAARERIRSYLSHLNTAEQNKILGLTAARLYGFPV